MKHLTFAFLIVLIFFAGSIDPKLSTENNPDSLQQPLLKVNSPKHELRSAWITTFTNLDWPSQRALPEDQQKIEFTRLLDEFQLNKINCVVVQIRASGDAFYPSKFAPWSEYLMGKQGLAPNYDPLKFMIDECHKRNMEFHAWLNPYRAISSIQFSNVSKDNLYHLHPNWFFKYGNSVYFNPGIKEVRQHILNVVGEVVHNYDIDGIHFDDYFYPYSVEGEKINDLSTFHESKNSFQSIEDWRRNNVDLLIKETSALIKFAKPYVKFGVSPLAIWRNKNTDSLGSDTKCAQTSFDNLYCDTKKWLKEKWVDYIAPQLYWSRNSEFASYNTLLNWWTSHGFDGHIYIGQALFRLEEENNKHRFSSSELIEQIKLNRKNEAIQGNMFFRAKTLKNNTQSFQDSLQFGVYKHFSLIPSMPWIDSIPPCAPYNLKIIKSNQGVLLKWKNDDKQEEKPCYYVVYRFQLKENININSAVNIVAIVRQNSFFDTTATEEFKYVVTSVDRLHNESTEYATLANNESCTD